MRLKPIRSIHIVIGLGTLALAVGCASSQYKSSTVLAIDVSDQTEDRILAYAAQAYRVQAQMDDQDDLEVLAFAHQTDVIFEGHPIYERNRFNGSVASALLSNHAGLHTPGTKADEILKTLSFIAQARKCSTSMVIFTDGGVEDQSSQALREIRGAIERLSRAANLKLLLVVGVDQQWRSQWEGWLKPLGNKALVAGMNDADQALAELEGK